MILILKRQIDNTEMIQIVFSICELKSLGIVFTGRL
jgi:hypothetical protein